MKKQLGNAKGVCSLCDIGSGATPKIFGEDVNIDAANKSLEPSLHHFTKVLTKESEEQEYSPRPSLSRRRRADRK